MQKKNVTFLLTPGGGPGILALAYSLKNSKKYKARLIMADSNPASGNMFLEYVDECYQIPLCTDKNFISAIIKLVKLENIDYYYSGLDEEMPIIAKYKHLIAAEGCKLLLPSELSLNNAWSKLNTYKLLKRSNIQMPKTVLLHNVDNIDEVFNNFGGVVVVKGSNSRGGRYIDIVDDIDKLRKAIQNSQSIASKIGMKFLLQEYIKGTEFNVSSLHSDKNIPIYAISRRKFENRMIKSTTNAAVIDFKENVINQALSAITAMNLFPGFNNVEIIVSSDDTPYLIEVNGGRTAAQDMNIVKSGINITDLFIDIVEGKNVKPIKHPKNGLASLKIRSDVIVNYDDIVNTKIIS